MTHTDERQCSSCATSSTVYGRRDVTRNFEGVPLSIPDVAGRFCTTCGELEFVSPESARGFLERMPLLQQQRRSMRAAELEPLLSDIPSCFTPV